MRRKVDFVRHVLSHTGTAGDNVLAWVCTGIPVRLLGLGPDPVADPRVVWCIVEGKSMVYEGELCVGGCARAFCRKDALKRHLDGTEACVGDHHGEWLIGNKRQRMRGTRKGMGEGKGKTGGKGKSEGKGKSGGKGKGGGQEL